MAQRQAIRHHGRAEDLATDIRRVEGVWRFQNAVQACMQLRHETTDEQAQALWDEGHAWSHLAHRLNPEEARQEFALSPWLAGLMSKESKSWLPP